MANKYLYIGVEPNSYSGQYHCMVEARKGLLKKGYVGVEVLLPQLDRRNYLNLVQHFWRLGLYFWSLHRERHAGHQFTVISLGSSWYFLVRIICSLMILPKGNIIIELHTTEQPAPFKKKILKHILDRAVRVVCLNDLQAKYYSIPSAKFSKRSNVVFPGSLAEIQERRHSQEIILGYLSLGAEAKGVYDFIHLAESCLRHDLVDKILLAVPYAKTKYCKKFHNKEHLERAIQEFSDRHPNKVEIYLDGVAGDDKRVFFSRVTHFVFPSKFPAEAMPVSLLEALAHGCYAIVLYSEVLRSLFEEISNEHNFCFYKTDKEFHSIVARSRSHYLKNPSAVASENIQYIENRCSLEQYLSVYKLP